MNTVIWIAICILFLLLIGRLISSNVKIKRVSSEEMEKINEGKIPKRFNSNYKDIDNTNISEGVEFVLQDMLGETPNIQAKIVSVVLKYDGTDPTKKNRITNILSTVGGFTMDKEELKERFETQLKESDPELKDFKIMDFNVLDAAEELVRVATSAAETAIKHNNK